MLTSRIAGSPWLMYPAHIMLSHYSANPEHIAIARRQKVEVKERQDRQDREKVELEALMVIARPIGKVLGDGTRHDIDSLPDLKARGFLNAQC